MLVLLAIIFLTGCSLTPQQCTYNIRLKCGELTQEIKKTPSCALLYEEYNNLKPFSSTVMHFSPKEPPKLIKKLAVARHELGDLEWEYERHLQKWSSDPYVDYDFEAYTKEENIIFYDPVDEGYVMLLKPKASVIRIRDKYECVERYRHRGWSADCKRKIKVESKEIVVFKDLYFQREEKIFTERTGWIEVYVYDTKPIKKKPVPAKISMRMKDLRAEIKTLKKEISEDKERQKKEYVIKHNKYRTQRSKWRACKHKNRSIRSENSEIRYSNGKIEKCEEGYIEKHNECGK